MVICQDLTRLSLVSPKLFSDAQRSSTAETLRGILEKQSGPLGAKFPQTQALTHVGAPLGERDLEPLPGHVAVMVHVGLVE